MRLLTELSPSEKERFAYDWRRIARPEQLPPAGDWYAWLIQAGRGFGKTRSGAECVREWVKNFRLVNLIGPTADDIRDVMVEGESGIMAICPRGERPQYMPSKRRLEWPNGARSLLLSADKPERIRGKQHMKLWCDEAASWRYYDSWDQAMFGLRLGPSPQVVVTTTPKPVAIIKDLLSRRGVTVTRGTTYDNRENLSPGFYSSIITKYEGTRLGRQELNAELLEDNPGALWRRDEIEALRITEQQFAGVSLARVVVGVDPSASGGEESDLCGIVAAGVDNQWPPHFYVLEDKSEILSPNAWAERVVALYKRLRADRIIAEVNNGGEMVEAVLRTKEMNFAYRAVHAARSKVARAEPVAALYEQGRVHHVGSFAALEDEMCDFDPATAKKSPDRMDALVWAATELMERSGGHGVGDYYKREGEKMEQEAKKLFKPATSAETVRCPRCDALAVARLGSGYRCNACGEQWGQQKPVSGGQPSRRDLIK